MKRLLTFLGLVSLTLGWSSPPVHAAVDCGTRRAPSHRSNCRCSPAVRRGVLRRRFKRKFRVQLKRECKATAALARRRCRKYGKVSRLRWRRTRSSVRTVFGYKIGFCAIRYACSIRRTKRSGWRWSRRMSKARGVANISQPRRGFNLRRVKALATRKGRAMCARQKGKILRFQLATPRCRNLRQTRQCRVPWRCFFRKKVRVFWCQ